MSASSPELSLRLASPGEIDRVFSGWLGGPLWRTVMGDGREFAVHGGRLGDRVFTYGDRARFHLSASADTLVCEPAERGDAAWQRQLLDTVLLSVAHQRGFELLHAAAVEWAGRLVAFAALSGGGKTSLAAELLLRGGRLFADDIVALSREGGAVVAHPAPPVMNLPRAHTGAGKLGRSLGSFDEEREDWIAVTGACNTPAPLAAIFLLDRRASAATRVERLAANPLHLLAHSVGFLDRGRRDRSRFELFADVAAATPIIRIRAHAALAPAALAALAAGALADVPLDMAGLAPA